MSNLSGGAGFGRIVASYLLHTAIRRTQEQAWRHQLATDGREASIGSLVDFRMTCRDSTDGFSQLTGLAAR